MIRQRVVQDGVNNVRRLGFQVEHAAHAAVVDALALGDLGQRLRLVPKNVEIGLPRKQPVGYVRFRALS